MVVSTHSRPKAADALLQCWVFFRRFNTQPPEGGCDTDAKCKYSKSSFNTQPPEGGWTCTYFVYESVKVSTHSRPKAAENILIIIKLIGKFQHTAARRRLLGAMRASAQSICFNTQPPEGGCLVPSTYQPSFAVSTHSRPKAAAAAVRAGGKPISFQHTAARRRLTVVSHGTGCVLSFQHTAARRRLLQQRWNGLKTS